MSAVVAGSGCYSSHLGFGALAVAGQGYPRGPARFSGAGLSGRQVHAIVTTAMSAASMTAKAAACNATASSQATH